MNFSSQAKTVFEIDTIVKIKISYRAVIELADSHNYPECNLLEIKFMVLRLIGSGSDEN
jgi:hypothetical protein